MVLVNQLLGPATLDVIEFLGFFSKNLACVLFLWILVMTTAVRLIVRQNSTNRGNKKCPVIVVILLLVWLLGFFKFFVSLQVGVLLGLLLIRKSHCTLNPWKGMFHTEVKQLNAMHYVGVFLWYKTKNSQTPHFFAEGCILGLTVFWTKITFVVIYK